MYGRSARRTLSNWGQLDLSLVQILVVCRDLQPNHILVLFTNKNPWPERPCFLASTKDTRQNNAKFN